MSLPRMKMLDCWLPSWLCQAIEDSLGCRPTPSRILGLHQAVGSAGAVQTLLLALLFTLPMPLLAKESICYGTTANGRLEGGVELPASGNNFTSYSATAALLGRTYVHSRVRDILLSSYQALETEAAEKQFMYAETGFAEGGRFRPHKTHRNGLSVDFMVPVLDEQGVSVHLPTHPFNKFGYDIEFDAVGSYEGYRIDFEAMAAHIVSLHRAAEAQGAGVWRVIFDPQLQPLLFATTKGDYLRRHLQFSRKRSWVRHDEHYHVDFTLACRPL